MGNWVGLKKLVFGEIVKVVEQIVLLPSWSSTSEEEYSKETKTKQMPGDSIRDLFLIA